MPTTRPFPNPTSSMTLDAGTYTVDKRLNFATKGVKIVCAPGVNIVGKVDSGDLFNVVANDVQFSGGMTMDGGGIWTDGNRGGLTVLDATFRNCRSGDHTCAISGNSHSSLYLSNIMFEFCSFATFLIGMRNPLIEQFEIRECGYGLKLDGGLGWVLRRGWIHDCGATMSVEDQGNAPGFLIEDMITERIRLGPGYENNKHALIYSIPVADTEELGARDATGTVQRCIVLGQKPDNAHNVFIPMGFECGGGQQGNAKKVVIYRQCYVRGANVAYAVTDRNKTSHVLFDSNFATDVNKVLFKNAGTQQVEVTDAQGNIVPWDGGNDGTNGPDAPPPPGHATWGDFIAHERTIVGRIGVGAEPGTPPAPPDPTPTPIPVPPAMKIQIALMPNQAINVVPSNLPDGTKMIQIDSISTSGHEVGPKVGPTGVKYNLPVTYPLLVPTSGPGFHPGWSIDITATAFDGTGRPLGKSSPVTIVISGDPNTTPWPPAAPPPPPPPPPADVIAEKVSVNMTRDELVAVAPLGTIVRYKLPRAS